MYWQTKDFLIINQCAQHLAKKSLQFSRRKVKISVGMSWDEWTIGFPHKLVLKHSNHKCSLAVIYIKTSRETQNYQGTQKQYPKGPGLFPALVTDHYDRKSFYPHRCFIFYVNCHMITRNMKEPLFRRGCFHRQG